ncbi:MAG: sigma-70 family RNA polymerase sigma factor [Gemmatimonadota bacterium]|nr:sigma-70 family RNA polymerase sigma factor [Gemmatimonadota bacterium]
MSPHDPASAALDALLARYSALVRRIGWRHGLSDADVDEVMQEVRLRLWHARPESEKIRELSSSYVYQTASSAALDLLRRRRARREDSLEDIVSDSASVSAVEAADSAIEHAELAAEVWRAVEALIESRRPIVRMYLTGYTREEISAVLGWSEAKTRNLLYRGLSDLRAALGARGISAASIS